MERLDDTAIRALRTLLENQPVTESKVGFAWRVAAGETMAAAATIEWSGDGTLRVTPKSDTWRNEIVRARPIVAQRLASLLGNGVVKKISIMHVADDGPRNVNRFSK